jgi:hypothetical protein
MLTLSDPQFVNRRLGGKRFLNGPADERSFVELLALINGLTREGEQLDLPSIEAAGSWDRAYAVYVALKRREAVEQAEYKAEIAGRNEGGRNLEFEWYVAGLEDLRRRARTSPIWSSLSEYLRLERDDLDDPVPPPDHPDHRWGRFADWREKAGRISAAVVTWDGLTAQQLSEVPAIIAQRRRDISIEQRLTALEQKILALESRLPTVQELILKDAENYYGEQYDG